MFVLLSNIALLLGHLIFVWHPCLLAPPLVSYLLLNLRLLPQGGMSLLQHPVDAVLLN